MLAQQISAWRQVRGLTQEELASRTGIPRPNLSAIERGQHDITVATLEK
ncbi:MAG: helix-turn-helix transcriptional regulator, partial [Deltaproteobacteria bacterium]|nr:helix-turn-helix transcriptional regulator [Deltaproteobacteria bacterium]